MKQLNIDRSLFEGLSNKKSKDRAQEVFNKLLAKHRKGKNPFDEMRTQSYPATNLKPGESIDEFI